MQPHVDMADNLLEAPSKLKRTYTQFSSAHHFPYVSAHERSRVHLGDIHCHYQVQEQKRDSDEIKAFGLCLGQAPQVDPACFIGRTSELSAMNDALQPESQRIEQRRLVLGGMGGIGKTQLAIAYAKRYGGCYKSVFWLNATSEMTLKASFRLIAQRILRAQEYEKLNDDQMLTRVRDWLSDTTNTRWLLIIDNYDDPEQFDIEEYYPYTAHGSIAVTTRLPDRVSGRQVRVQPLQCIEESLDILQTRSQRNKVRADQHARRLAERLGGLPLALATAGAYLHKSTLTFERYLQEYEKRWNIDSRRPLKLQEYQDRTLYTTWDLSYARLEVDDPSAAQMLKLLAYFDNQCVWYRLLYAGLATDLPAWLRELIADPVGFESLMRTLVDYCLLEVQTATQSYSIHSCVHDWTLAGLNKVIDAQQYWYAFDCVATSISDIDRESLGHVRYARLTAHATRLVHDRFHRDDLLDGIRHNRLNMALHIAQLLRQQVQLKGAEQMYTRVLRGYEKALGLDHTSTLDTVHNLGILYANQGKLEEAEQMYQRALTGYITALGPDHHSTLSTINNLGNLYADQGKLNDAEQMYMRALAEMEKASGPDHRSTLRAVHNLGILYRAQGKLDDAEQMYMRALAGMEKGTGADHLLTLDTVHNLGSLYRVQGKLDEAEQMYMRALAGTEKALGPEHTSTLDTVHDLGSLYCAQGKLDKAEQMYMRALAGTEKALGPDHASTLTTVNSLGSLYYIRGKLDKTEQMYMRALAGSEKALGSDHISTLRTVHNLGNLYYRQAKLGEAEQMYQRALAGYEKALGPDHTHTLRTVRYLGKLYYKQGKLDESKQMFRRVQRRHNASKE